METNEGDALWVVIMHSNDKLVLIDAQRQTLVRPERVCPGKQTYITYFRNK